jgi:hypothetical protein
LNQYFRQMVPDTGPFDAKVTTDAVSALFNRVRGGSATNMTSTGAV